MSDLQRARLNDGIETLFRPEGASQSSLGQSDQRERRPRLLSSSLPSPERAEQRLRKLLFRPFRAWTIPAIQTQDGATRLPPLRSALGWFVDAPYSIPPDVL